MCDSSIKPPVRTRDKGARRCLSCGATENMARRKYCSPQCRQKLHSALNRRTGLLIALQVRYATFYFTDVMINMDILPYGKHEILSYMLIRSPGKKPVDEFCILSELLGNAWWAETRRTKKRYKATQHILEKANRKNASESEVIPPAKTVPAVRKASLIKLKLGNLSWDSDNLRGRIKNAYRQQAKKYHPDLGGNTEMFRKIHEAYESLLQWSENPTFTTRRGFPDRWYYDGSLHRWIQPVPVSRRL